MKITGIGGEFSLIQRLKKISDTDHHQVIQGIGDDAAVLKTDTESASYLLVTTDTLIENQHFKRQWASAEQIGFKAGESNASDIAAMGGGGDWLVVSLALPEDVEVDWVEGMYRGLNDSCRRNGITVVGGDTTRGPVVMISITLLGHVVPSNLCLRSDAKAGDILMVTGLLGAPAAAVALLDKGIQPCKYLMERLTAPRCRMDVVATIAPLANAMIDISDGLAAETRHICHQSKVGAELAAAEINFHPEVTAAAEILNCDPLQWVLGGGEEYELLFSIPAKNLPALHDAGIDCHEVGVITPPGTGAVLIASDGRRSELKGGYDHFGVSHI
jgi:thiamine-monophosphate kinase